MRVGRSVPCGDIPSFFMLCTRSIETPCTAPLPFAREPNHVLRHVRTSEHKTPTCALHFGSHLHDRRGVEHQLAVQLALVRKPRQAPPVYYCCACVCLGVRVGMCVGVRVHVRCFVLFRAWRPHANIDWITRATYLHRRCSR